MSFERLEPDTPEWTAYMANHEHRYAFAAARLAHLRPPARVLDAATGVGYGAAQLADRCGVQIVAVDRDAHALHLARTLFHRPLVEYLENDCATLAQAGNGHGPYDAVVSFETVARAGFWLQKRLRGFTLGPALPERASDFEIVPFASADECERQGPEGPFVLIAVATT